MHHWTKGIMGDDPPYLAVGTEVSAKYKGAFCEAKVRKVVRSVKCKVTFKLGLGSAVVSDDQVRGTLRVGSVCEVKHPDKKEFVEATINKITDSSQYTVVFDDGDITTLRRTALCLKSGRHFAVSETLDQLPLTHPEHFSNPVIGGRKGRRSRQAHEDTSDEEDTTRRGSKKKEEKEADIGRVVCVELGDKKKQKDNWFPGLVVAPTAQDTVRIRVRDEYLVRSFKDGRYFTVPKKEANEFTREIGAKVDNNTLKTAVEKALLFLDRDELPPHWDRDVLFGIDESSAVSDSDGGLDSDSSDDEPREEKDHFVAQLYKFMDDRGTPINNAPSIANKDIDLYKLFKVVHKLGGYNRVTNHNQWKTIARKVGFDQTSPSIKNLVKQAYKKFLHSFEEFYRKLGCTMVNHPRHSRPRHHGGRSLIRDRDRATPVNTPIAIQKPSSETSEKQDDIEAVAEDVAKTKLKTSLVEEETSTEDKSTLLKPKEEKNVDVGQDVKEEISAFVADKVPKKETEGKKERDSKREKECKKEPGEDKSIASEHSRDGSGTSKDVDSSELVSQMKQTVKQSDSPVNVDVVEKIVPKKESTASLKDEKTKRAREGKGKTPKQKKGDQGRVTDSKLSDDVSEEQTEETESSKTSEDEKSDDSKKRSNKKEDDEKQTRSKSKEDLTPKSETTSSRSRDFDKPFTPRPRKSEEEEEPSKKRGRKRKDNDQKLNPDEILGQLGVGIGVGVGDKLKVYYGPTHESKVTYEAKVIEVEKETYLVHYTGWNTRYDEWIKRGRIAENLSWTPSRAKRLKLQQAKAASSTSTPKPTQAKRGRPSMSGRDSTSCQRPRSATPSSVTSSSSRTKSPGTPAPRNSKHALSFSQEYRRRTRRMSGHTDLSVASEVSASESDDFESEPETEPTRTRSRSERVGLEKEEAAKHGAKEEVKRSLRKKVATRKEEQEVEMEVDDDDEDEMEEDSTETSVVSDPQIVEKRRSTRTRKPKSSLNESKEEGVKRDPSTESEEEQSQPKGRDFDLNQIRSELKGIEKAVKLPQDIIPKSKEKDAQIILDDKTGIIDVRRLSAEKEALLNKSLEASKKALTLSSTKVQPSQSISPGKVNASTVTKVLPSTINRVQTPTPPKVVALNTANKAPVTLPKVIPVAQIKATTTAIKVLPAIKVSTSAKVLPIASAKVLPTASAKVLPTASAKVLPTASAKVPPTASAKVLPTASLKALPTASAKVLPTASAKVLPTNTTKQLSSAASKPLNSPSGPDDIYEFKEPEPFEFEVRAKREHPSPIQNVPDERLKSTRKSGGKLQEEVEISPPKKNPARNSPSKVEAKDATTPLAGVVKKRFRRSVGKKMEALVEAKKVEISPSKLVVEMSDPVTPQKVIPTSACEEAFDKLCESPVFRPVHQRRTPSPGEEMEPLSLFSELPGDGKDDAEDRLVISETDDNEAESQEPLFTYSQRHHEELLPTLSTDIISISSPLNVFTDSALNISSSSILATFSKSLETPVNKGTLSIKMSSPKRANVKSPSPTVTSSSPKLKSPSPVALSPSVKISSPNRTVVSPVPNSKLPNLSKPNSKSPVLKRDSITDSSVLEECVLLPLKSQVINDVQNEDVIVRMMKLYNEDSVEQDKEEQDSISAAIQRVIAQSMKEENVEPICVPKSNAVEQQPEKPASKSDIQVPIEDNQKRENLKRKSGARKPVLSQEFVDDSDSDSSDEENRLVIDKMDDDSLLSLQGDESNAELPPNITEALQEDTSAKKTNSIEDIKPITEVSCKTIELAVEEDTTKVLDNSVVTVVKEEVAKVFEESTIVNDPPIVIPIVIPNLKTEVCVAEIVKVEDEIENDLSLLCEETIPGSPQPVPEPLLKEEVCKNESSESKSSFLEMPFASAPGSSVASVASTPKNISPPSPPVVVVAGIPSPTVCISNEAAPVIENTPPTTPDSSLSITSSSPREELIGLSPSMDVESFKSHGDCFEDSHKAEHYSEDDIEISNSSDNRLQSLKLLPKKLSTSLESELSPNKKRPRSRKRSECESGKRTKLTSSRSILPSGAASDSDDTSENSTAGCAPLTSSENILLISSRSPRPSRYNFYVDLDPKLDGSQRIALLQQKLQELRKTYLTLKSELAGIDRRRKKLRRREREEKQTKQEVACS